MSDHDAVEQVITMAWRAHVRLSGDREINSQAARRS